MKGLKLSILLIFLAVCTYQCQKEISAPAGGGGPIPASAPLSARLQGNVLDEAGAPAAGVTITVGTRSALTDSKGYFSIDNAPLDKNASLVTAEKAGYFKAFRSFAATSGANQVLIKLTKRTLAGSVDAATGGAVTLNAGAAVALPANGVVTDANGAAYTGTVNVYGAYIDPTADDIAETVPGSFLANDKENRRVLLSSFGMFAVELEGSAGEKLQIKSGSKATLTAPIPASIVNAAPATIPMWYVNESTGIWKEEGSAVKQGNSYSGEVSHFTYWNYDVPVPGVQLQVKIKNAAGLPVVYAHVVVKTAAGYNGIAHGYTDSLGQTGGLVPSNQALILEVWDQCGNAIYSQNIAPLGQATVLPDITITNSGNSLIAVRGTLLNCSGAPVTDGYALIYLDNIVRYASVDAGGNFEVAFVHCGSSAPSLSVLGVDEGGGQQGATLTSVAITSPLTQAGPISACGTSAAQFLNYNIDGATYTITSSSADSLMAYTSNQGPVITFITASSATANDHINIVFESAAMAPGTYNVSAVNVQAYSGNNTILSPSIVTLTSFAQATGEFYEGNFSIQFKDAQNITRIVSGNFRIRRTW